MATQPRKLPYERRLRDLDRLYRSALAELAARVEHALQAGDLLTARRMRLQLAAATAVLDQLGAAVRPLARELVDDAWRESAAVAARQVGELAVTMPELPGAFASVSREGVAQLQASLLDQLDSAHQTVGRRVRDVFARRQREAAVRALLGADGSPRASAQWLERQLRQSTTGLVDRAGKQWSLDTYSRMAARTVTREAVTQGAIARMASHSVHLARVSSHASSCEVCRPYEGRLVSLDGETTEHDGEAVLAAGDIPPYHPNCRHSLAPFVPAAAAIRAELDARAASTLDRLRDAGVAGA